MLAGYGGVMEPVLAVNVPEARYAGKAACADIGKTKNIRAPNNKLILSEVFMAS